MLDVEFLTEVLEERKQLRLNLTAVQKRCTELFIENRRLKGIPDEVLCDCCLRTISVDPTFDGQFNTRMLAYLGWTPNPRASDRYVCDTCTAGEHGTKR